MASLNEATVRDALLVLWDVCTDLADGDDAITEKLDQLHRQITAVDIPKATATKARAAVDAGTKAERAAATT